MIEIWLLEIHVVADLKCVISQIKPADLLQTVYSVVKQSLAPGVKAMVTSRP